LDRGAGCSGTPVDDLPAVRKIILYCNFKPKWAKHCHEALVPHLAKSPALQPDVWGGRPLSDGDTLKGYIRRTDMPDDPQKAAFDNVMGMLQTVTTRVMELPKDKREAALEMARRDCMDLLAKQNFDADKARPLADSLVDAVRAVMAQVEAGGGPGGKKG
jgi:hypothetical protein